MKYAFISDVHANEIALKNVLDDAIEQGVERIVCLGDVVGYGPAPAETISLLKVAATVVLAGNHDDAVSGRYDAASFIELAKHSVLRHRQTLGKQDLAWLKTRPYTCEGEGFVATHGDFVNPRDFNYIDDASSAASNFNACPAQLMFCGHTHEPKIFVIGRSGVVHEMAAQDFAVEEGKRYIVNPGSVGFPRELDGRCLSSYAIWDSEFKTVVYRYLPFCVSSVMQRGRTGRRAGVWIALAIAAAVAIAPLAFRRPVDGLSLAGKEIAIHPGARYFRSNLKVSGGPVLLKVVFTDGRGREIAVVRDTVTSSSSRKRKIPAGAVKARVDVLKFDSRQNPSVLQLSPDAGED